MRRLIRFLLASAVVICVAVPPAGAQYNNQERPYVLLQNMPKFLEAYLSQLMLPFRMAAGDDQVLTNDDVSKRLRQMEAKQRANQIQILVAADLDGDMVVTSDEWQAAHENIEFPAANFADWDTDNDGVVTAKEVYSSSNNGFRGFEILRQTLPLKSLMDLESSKDGALTALELEQAGRQAFTHYDIDGNGVLSSEEMTALKRDQAQGERASGQQFQLAMCGLPRPEQNQKVFFISGYEGSALSDVTVAGQDAVTNTVEIKIEPGDDPLYVMATSYVPMIWRVTGQVDRVARFVGISESGSGGVTGLQKERVVQTKGRCVSRLPDAEAAGRAILQSLGMALGKALDGAYSAYSLSTISLPSQAASPDSWRDDKKRPSPEFSWGPLQSANNVATEAMRSFSPGGIVKINVSEVVAARGVEKYEVLPREAGLAQLLENGSLVHDPRLGYLVQRPIARFPAGLAGAHSVGFVLADGVPRPGGNPGHSSVMTYEQAQRKLRPNVRRLPVVPEDQQR